MKNLLKFLVLLIGSNAFGQGSYWQQETNVTISVSLNDQNHSLDGFETIEYVNHSPDTLAFIWFHLWPNAYKNDRTDFSEQLLQNGRADFYFSTPEEKGYINQLNFKVNDQKAEVQNTSKIDIVKLILPAPLAPGKKAIISTPFHVQLPYYFSRGGHIGNDYQVTQWFPKPAVYDAKGWHAMPYLDQGEFYSEFGTYDVQITLPAAYTVTATGQLQNEDALADLKSKGKWQTNGETNTWHYIQKNCHDFAWFASKEMTAHYDTAQLLSGKVIDVFSFYKKDSEDWENSVDYIKDGLKYYSAWLGDYPYDIASVVQGPENISSGGMEYPTITLITTSETGQQLDGTIVHEVGHNWFYAALGSNERQHPWMDEGMNTFYQHRYENIKYGNHSALQEAAKGFTKKLPEDEERLLSQTLEKLHKDVAIDKPSTAFSQINYGLVVYNKAAAWMKKLEQQLGVENFDSSMKNYYRNWQFKHPYPEDFKRSIVSSTQENVEPIFKLLHTTGPLNAPIDRTVKMSFLFNLKSTNKYKYINLAPAIGYNNYDKLMLGALIHNYQLPINKINFIAGGLYGLNSKKINSFGHVSYHLNRKWVDAEGSLSLSNFSQNDFTRSDGTSLFPRIRRIVPSIKITLFDHEPSYSRRLVLQLKTFLLKEDRLDFKTITTPTDTTDVVDLASKNTTINRLIATYSDNRLLFPYSIKLTADQGKDFIRAGLSINYFFNYSDNKSGLNARFFAGKFIYLTSKTNLTRFANDRYAINMTGANGYEDYTYSNYFIGRNEFEGYMSQQIMERDGFFKVRTDLLSDKIGKTDDWLMSMNLSTDLPNEINPLRILPIKIPIKIFADIGTYADAWKNNPASGRFLYDAGLQIPLFSSIVNIYIPILYSKVYSNYFKSTLNDKRFFKTMSFSLDMQRIGFKKLFRGIPF